MQTGSLFEIKEISENICGLLDDVWRHNSSSYPEERMRHVFDVIGLYHNRMHYFVHIITDIRVFTFI